MRTASLAVLTSVIGCTSMKPGSGTSPSSSGVAPVVPAADDDYAALWYQGGRQVGGTALAEAEALGRAFTLAGYALDTDHGPVVQRITNIAVCDGVATWPPDVRGTWVVATGRLERADDCEPTSGIGLQHECHAYRLVGCEYDQRVRAEDVAVADRARINGPWGRARERVDLGTSNTVRGTLVPWQDLVVLRWPLGIIELQGCDLPSQGEALAGEPVEATGQIEYLPPRAPEGTTTAELVGTPVGRLLLTDCVVTVTDE